MGQIKKIEAKLGDMRKAVEWVVYPKGTSDAGLLVIQADKRIAAFDPTTGKGMLSKACLLPPPQPDHGREAGPGSAGRDHPCARCDPPTGRHGRSGSCDR
ncbi:MAG: hypothetical protein ACRETL_02100, partial [Gammaproteobacteria bacterium]